MKGVLLMTATRVQQFELELRREIAQERAEANIIYRIKNLRPAPREYRS
jgi:hypothetical protein